MSRKLGVKKPNYRNGPRSPTGEHTMMASLKSIFLVENMMSMSMTLDEIRFSTREGGVAELLARSHHYRQYCLVLVVFVDFITPLTTHLRWGLGV